MLFDIENDKFESERERNLYYKYFAGYYFNELISGWEKRVSGFWEILASATHSKKYISILHKLKTASEFLVSFDYHANRIASKTDRGEVADIMIYDKDQNIMVVIEAKYLTDPAAEKDISEIRRRIDAINVDNPEMEIIPCLLITCKMWNGLEEKKGWRGSFFDYWNGISENERPILILWDKLLDYSTGSAKEFLQRQLNKT